MAKKSDFNQGETSTYVSGAVFIRRKTVSETEKLHQARIIPILGVHEILEIDIPYEFVSVEVPGELPDGFSVPSDVREYRYLDPYWDSIQEAVKRFQIDRYRLGQSNSDQNELTDSRIMSNRDDFVALVTELRAPIKRGTSDKSLCVKALKDFVVAECARRGITQERSFVWLAIRNPASYPAMNESLRTKLDNFVQLFRASAEYDTSFDSVLTESLAELDSLKISDSDY